jgi:hypothetical protein
MTPGVFIAPTIVVTAMHNTIAKAFNVTNNPIEKKRTAVDGS